MPAAPAATAGELVAAQRRLEEVVASLPAHERTAAEALVGRPDPGPVPRALADEELVQFATQGWVVLRGLLDGWVHELRAAVGQMFDEPNPWVIERSWHGVPGRSMRDDRAWLGHPAIRAFARWGPLGSVARELLGGDATLVLSGVFAFAKEPGCLHGSPWHVDRPRQGMPYDRACNTWVALDDGGPDAGVVQLLAGSHHWDDARCAVALGSVDANAPHAGGVAANVSGIPGLAPGVTAEAARFDLRRGDIVCFDGRMAHGARGNRGDHRFLSMAALWWVGEPDALRATAEP